MIADIKCLLVSNKLIKLLQNKMKICIIVHCTIDYYKFMEKINANSIWVLSALDKFMTDNRNKPEIFVALFQKKKMIIELLQSMKIDAKKYKAIVAKAYKEDNGDIKKCAEIDLLKCKDGKSDEMIEQWFKQVIQDTGAFYQQQEKLYQKYQANIKKNVQPTALAPSNINKSNVKAGNESQNVIDTLVSFKSIDDLLQSNEGNKQYFGKLLQRKQKLLGLVKSKALTAQKYKSTLQLYITKTTNQGLKSDYKFQLQGIEDFHDGDVGAWYKEIIEETSDKLEEQLQKLNSKKPAPEVKVKPIQKKQIAVDKQFKQVQNKKVAPSQVGMAFDINSMTSFKIFDDYLQKMTKSKDKYRDLLNKKKKFLDLAKKGALTAQKYKALLVTAIKDAKDPQIKEGMEFELSQLEDFHDNNVQQWFKDVVSSSEIMLQDQEAIMQKLEKGESVKPLQDDSDQIILSDDDIDLHSDSDGQLKMPTKQQPAKPTQVKKQVPAQSSKSNKMGKLGINPNTIFSLKALDDFMTQFEKDAETFCLCFQRKEAIFNMMKTGEITPEKYKQLQESSLKTSPSDKLKEIVQMELFDLKDMCDGNVMEWFESLVNDAGFNYEEQQAKYQKWKGEKGTNLSQVKKIVKPNIAEVVCFTAVNLLFEQCVRTVDIVYYRQLLSKRERLTELVAQKKLVAAKYRDINKATASKTENQFLRNTIAEEQQMLKNQFRGKDDAWFEEIYKNISKNPPELKLPENQEMKKVNSWPVEKKKKYLICTMAPYESLLRYYKNNEIPLKNNRNLIEYEKFKKEDATKALQQLEKNPDLDVYNISQQLFPQINESIFYGESLADLKKKAEKATQLFAKQISTIKDYAGKIKKSTNPQNLQMCKQSLATCEANIKYLKSWPKGQLIGFPSIKQEKVEKYNLDVVRYLEKNQIQIQIAHIEGIQKNVFKIFVADFVNARFFAQVHNGPQQGIKTIVKLPVRDMNEIYRGEKKLIIFRIYEKGFFGKLSVIGQNGIETSFIRNNILEERVQVGKAMISYVIRVQKPTKPLITQIIHYEMKPLEPFKNNPKVEEELIKNYQSIK